jgi:hypothetical protein
MRHAIRWNRNPSIIVLVDENLENDSGIPGLLNTSYLDSAARCSRQSSGFEGLTQMGFSNRPTPDFKVRKMGAA